MNPKSEVTGREQGGQRRWTMDICGSCQARVVDPADGWTCSECGRSLREVEEVEVVPALALEAAEREVERERDQHIAAMKEWGWAEERLEAAESALSLAKEALEETRRVLDADHEPNVGVGWEKANAILNAALSQLSSPGDR